MHLKDDSFAAKTGSQPGDAVDVLARLLLCDMWAAQEPDPNDYGWYVSQDWTAILDRASAIVSSLRPSDAAWNVADEYLEDRADFFG